MDKKLIEKLTNGGRVPLPANVNLKKLERADQIIEGISRGDTQAIADFKIHMGARFGEVLTTGDDFIHAFTQLVALQVDNEFEAKERTWNQVADVQIVSSFDAPKVYSIDSEVTGFARPQTEPGKPADVAPIVPESSPYPVFKFSGELAAAGEIHKAGGVFSLSFEKIVSNAVDLVPVLPTLITEFLLEREEWDVWAAILGLFADTDLHLDGGTTLDGTIVPADAPLNRGSLDLAIQQADLREINGTLVSVSSYTLVVPVGTGRTANWYLNTLDLDSIATAATGTTRTYSVNNYNPLSKITNVVESRYFTGSQWALIPTPGAISGTKKFLNLGRLRGHEGPELRVQNLTGSYLGGGAISPFEGSYETDDASFRGRIISGALVWNTEYAVVSDGDGA